MITTPPCFVHTLSTIDGLELDQALIGRDVGRSSYVEGQSRERQLKEQTEAIVRRLGNVGIDGRLHGREMAMVGLVSGIAKPIPAVRNSNMLPSVQSRNVHEMLKSLRYLFDTTRKNQLRMLVVSGGWTPLNDYRTNHKAHTRRMSKFASHPLLKQFGIEVEFYNIENTIHRADDGAAMLNLHSHVLFKCRRYLGKKRWNEFLTFARNFFPKGYVHDSRIDKPNEVVKYVFKPNEFDRLTDEELGELFQQVSGGRVKHDPETGEIETRKTRIGEVIPVGEGPLKFFHPLGSLRKFRQTLRENRQKLVLVPTADGRHEWRVTERKEAQERPEATDGIPEDNRVLAVTRPMPAFTERMEPCLIVQNYDGDFADLIKRNKLEDRLTEARRLFEARRREDLARKADGRAGEAAPMKHTTTTTVREDGWACATEPPPDLRPPPTEHGRWLQ